MRRLVEALERSGASAAEAAYVVSFDGGVAGFYAACADPAWLMRLASVASVEPRQSLAIAVDAARAVLPYVGSDEPRPRRAVAIATLYLDGTVASSQCANAAQAAEDVAQGYRDAKASTKVERRAFRAAQHASLAAAKAAMVARDAALTTELAYDQSYTFEDAWAGARVACALAASQGLLEAVEAACAATAARVTIETSSAVAGSAAAEEARPAAFAWAARIVRKHVSVAELGRKLGA